MDPDRFQITFNRYMLSHREYDRSEDTELHDFYRLLGFHVHRNGRLGARNQAWLSVLEGKKLASVRVYRAPSDRVAYIEILFKPAFRKAWMDGPFLTAPRQWLVRMGLINLRYFQLEVGY